VPDVAGPSAVTVQPAGVLRPSVTSVSGTRPGLGSVALAVTVPPGATTAGISSVYGCLTTIGVVPVTPSTVTAMVAAPAATAVTLPFGLTEATFGLLLR
jgi:hypothetical protein